MIVLQDEELLHNWLGDDLPADVVTECELRTKWFHSAGSGGALGALSLIEMLRFLGYQPPAAEERPVDVDWRSVPHGTPIEAQFGGEWMPGTFGGIIMGGTLEVHLDGDEYVHECNRNAVRLAGDTAGLEPLTVLVTSEDESLPDEVAMAEYVEPPQVEDTGAWPVVPEGDLVVGGDVLVESNGEILDGILVDIAGDKAYVVLEGQEGRTEFGVEHVTML